MTFDLPAFLAAEVQLGTALDDLARAIDTLEAQQKKHDTLTQRIATLARRREGDWDVRARSEMTSLNARHALQEKTLDQARAAIAAARTAVRDRSKAHDEALIAYRETEIARYLTQQGLVRRQGALARVVQTLLDMRRREAGLPDRDSEAYRLMIESYDYIPFDLNRFLDALARLDMLLSLDPDHADPRLRYRPVSFLEVGAGPGRNLLLVKISSLLMTSTLGGFDLNQALIENGQKAFGLTDELFTADALEYDYGQWDVLFSYRLFREDDWQRRLEAHMVASMKPGAWLVAPFTYDLTLYPELESVDPAFDIWKKRA